MKKLNITKEQFEKSKYFTSKYGSLEYVSESGKVFKTNKGKVLKFKESNEYGDGKYGELNEKFHEFIEGNYLEEQSLVEDWEKDNTWLHDLGKKVLTNQPLDVADVAVIVDLILC